MLMILTGDDKLKIERRLFSIQNLVSSYCITNTNDCQLAIDLVKQNSLLGIQIIKLHIDLEHLKIDSNEIERIVNSNNYLIIIPSNWDGRTKQAKVLAAFVEKYELVSAWDLKKIKSRVIEEASLLQLELNDRIVEYLAESIGNNFVLLRSELEKLWFFSPLTLELVEELVPSVTHSSLKLSKIILQGRARQSWEQLEKILAFSHPLPVFASLFSQFYTYLLVKIAIENRMANEHEIAKFAGVSNYKRIYFLKKEIENVTLDRLLFICDKLIEIQTQLKKGGNSILPVKVAILCHC
jgi:DNA polymerase III subunit delta